MRPSSTARTCAPQSTRRAGRSGSKARGRIFAGRFQVPVVAWYLHLHARDVDILPFGPGTTFAQEHSVLAADPRYPEVTKTRRWIVGNSCGRG